MVRNIKRVGLLLILGFIISSVFINTEYFFKVIFDTLELWLYKVLPSIFCFYIFSSLIINLKLSRILFYPLKVITPFIKFQTTTAKELFFISFLIGNPSSISLIRESYDNNLITKDDANNLLKCSHFMNPLFIVAALSTLNSIYSIFIIISLVIVNFSLSYLLTRKNNTTIDSYQIINVNNIFQTLNSLIPLLLMIAAIMVLCNIIKATIIYYLNIINISNIYITIFLSFLEISTGFKDILSLNITDNLKLIILNVLNSFGSLSIIMQGANCLTNTDLSFKGYLMYRIISSIIVLIISLLITFII